MTTKTIHAAVWPVLSYRGARAALEFLATAFGFEERACYAREDDPSKDPDRLLEQVVAAGTEVVRALKDEDYGSRGFTLRAPEEVSGASGPTPVSERTPIVLVPGAGRRGVPRGPRPAVDRPALIETLDAGLSASHIAARIKVSVSAVCRGRTVRACRLSQTKRRQAAERYATLLTLAERPGGADGATVERIRRRVRSSPGPVAPYFGTCACWSRLRTPVCSLLPVVPPSCRTTPAK